MDPSIERAKTVGMAGAEEPLVAGDEALTADKVVGWYRVDDSRRFWWVLIPMVMMGAGSVIVGLAFTELDAFDPARINPTFAPPPGRLSAAAQPTTGETVSGAPDLVGASDWAPDVAPRSEVLAQRGRVSPFARAVRRVHAPEGRAPTWRTWVLFALGLLFVASGPATLIMALRRSWRDDRFLLLRVDALVHRHAEGQDEVPWDDVARVEWDAQGYVALRMRDEDAPDYELRSRFAGIDPQALAARLEEIRRKSTFGLLPRKRAT